MKVPALLLIAALSLGCEKVSAPSPDEISAGADPNAPNRAQGARATPGTPAKTLTPKATPKEGNWMWKGYENPLDKTRPKEKKK